MPPPPRRQTKLARHPAAPPPESEQEKQGEQEVSETVEPPSQDQQDTSDQYTTRVPKVSRASGRTGARARNTSVRSGRGQDRIMWTSDAKAVRAALTTYQAQVRKLGERADEARKVARRVSAEDLEVIVSKVAQDTGADAELLAQVAGLKSE